MKYHFINKFGEIEIITNLKEYGNLKGVYGLDWKTLCTWRPSGRFTKEDKNFLDKYNLKYTLFNIACLHGLNSVFIHEENLKELKRGKD